MARPERTRQAVLDGVRQVQEAFKKHNLIANVRLETYDNQNYFHLPPPIIS